MPWIRALAAAVVVFAGCSSGDRPASTAPPTQLVATVVATHAHDAAAFTEGLVFVGRDRLFESSGGYGSSDVREVDPDTGAVRRRSALPGAWFGEGLAARGAELVQLTWKEGRARRWDLDLRRIGEHRVDGEGWGLSYDAGRRRWVQSDGSGRLTFRDGDFRVVGHLEVRRAGAPVDDLNELEVVGEQVWANVWRSDELLRIDLGTGRVTGVVDLAELGPPSGDDPEAVLNGVAHRPGDPAERLWVTGKRWPVLYEIALR